MLAAYSAWLGTTAYFPKLVWKKGERDAFKSTRDFINKFTTPIYLIPPAGDFDHDEGRVIGPAEHVRLFGPRLFDSRGNGPVFVDALHLDDTRHRVAFNVHPLTALLERARLAGAQAWPMTSYGRSDEYQEAVAKAHLKNECPVAIQIALGDLGAPNLAIRLKSLCNQVSCDPHDVVLVIDGGPLFLRDASEELTFTNLLIDQLNNLPQLYEWKQITFTASSLSELQKVKPDQEKFVRRSEWHIHQLMLAKKGELYRTPVFSDYGIDYSSNLAPRKARPSAKLAYTTEDGLLFVKGQNVKNAGYEAIYPVADKVVASEHFKGQRFSAGDGRIWLLSQRRGGTGNAPTWRWASVDHHLAMVGYALFKNMGLVPMNETADIAEQGDLLSLIPPK